MIDESRGSNGCASERAMRALVNGKNALMNWRGVLVACATILVCSILTAAYLSLRQQRIVSHLRGLGADVTYKSESSYVLSEWPFPPAGPTWKLRLWEPTGIYGWLPSWVDLAYVDSVATIRLSDATISRQTMVELGILPGLESLDLSKSQLSIEDFNLLQNRRTIKYLALYGVCFDFAACKHLAQFESLEELELSKSAVAGKNLGALSDLPRLRRLWLDDTRITSDDLGKLTKCARLEQLSVSGSNVDDDGLRHLKALTCLRTLNLRCTAVSSDGVNTLRNALPGCAVFFDGRCARE